MRPCTSSSQPIVFLIITLLAINISTLALPNPDPLSGSTAIAGSRGSSSGKLSSTKQPSTTRITNAFKKFINKLREECRSDPDRCTSDWEDKSPDYPSFSGAAEKKAKVEQRKKKKPDADPEDKDFCAGEVCDGREECVVMKGHEKDTLNADWWFTCCPKQFSFAGRDTKCCNRVDSKGVCTK